MRVAVAPVKAPRTCPKSSLSSKFSGMAPQLMATNGPLLRALRRWISSASISLPVPVSPPIKTEISVAATLSMRRKTSRIPGQAPIRSPKLAASSLRRRSRLSKRSWLRSSALATMSEAWAAKTVSSSKPTGWN